MDHRPDLNDIRNAQRRISPYIHRTPVMTCAALDAMTGNSLFLKCENLQKGGVFKVRGAFNAVLSMTTSEAEPGVVTHSSGNHAAALSMSAQLRGIPAYIVMPANAPRVKVEAVRSYGGQITFCEPTLAARESSAEALMNTTGASLIHPYNDWRIIAGQATCALELLEQIPDLEVILVPVGGGGLLSGSLLCVKSLKAEVRVYGCEPAGADDACRSLRAGRIIPSVHPHTIADGLLTSLGDKTFAVIRELVEDIVLTPEEAIETAMYAIWERMKIVVEPSAAVPLACLLTGKPPLKGKRIGVILSGGNVDFDNVCRREA